jgi:hypothetical protein
VAAPVKAGAVSNEIPEVRNIALINPIPVSVKLLEVVGAWLRGSPAMKFLISISPRRVQSPAGRETEREAEGEGG